MPTRDDVIRWGGSFVFHALVLIAVSKFASFEAAVVTGLAWIMTDANRCERILWRSKDNRP